MTREQLVEKIILLSSEIDYNNYSSSIALNKKIDALTLLKETLLEME